MLVFCQVRPALPGAIDGVGGARDPHDAIVGHALDDLLLQALHEAVEEGVAADHDDVGEQRGPQPDRQALQGLEDEVGDAGLSQPYVGGVEQELRDDEPLVP